MNDVNLPDKRLAKAWTTSETARTTELQKSVE
jgi:hypothetical protein